MSAHLNLYANPAGGLPPERFDVPAGTHVGAWLEFHKVPEGSPAALNGNPVPADQLEGLILAEGDTLEVVKRPGEIASLTIAGFLEVVAGLSALEIAVSAVATAAAIYGTRQLYSGLIPPVLDLDGESARSGRRTQVTDGENVLRPFEPTDFIVGRLRVYPTQAARSYTQVQGGRLYQHVLYHVGAGPLEIAEPKYGDQALLATGQSISFTEINELGAGKLDNVRMEFRRGTGSETALSLFTRNVVEEHPREVLTKKKSWVVRNTRGAVRSFTVILSFTEGLVWIQGKNAKLVEARVIAHVEYRKAGTTDAWRRVKMNMHAKSIDAVHRSKTIDLDEGDVAEQEVRIRRHTVESGIEVKDKLTWAALLSDQPDEDLLVLDNQSYVAARWRLSGELAGGARRFNVRATTLGDRWNGSTYVANEELFRPADLSRYVLQTEHNARAVTDSLLELSAYQDWADDCQTEGYQVGLNARGMTTFQVLQRLAMAGRASFDQVGGKFTVVRDIPLDTAAGPDLYVTPRNSFGFSLRKELSIKPDGLRVQFTNDETGYLADELLVFASGFTKANAVEYDRLDLTDVTNGDPAEKLGKYHLAAIVQRAETVVVNMDLEWLRARRGSWARMNSDVARFGEAFGRLVSVTKNGGGDITHVELDTVVTIEGGEDYVMRFRKSDGKSVVAAPLSVVVSADGNRSTVALSPVILAAAEQPEPPDLWLWGTETDQEGRDYKVIGIQPGRDFSAEVRLQPAAETILVQFSDEQRASAVTIPPKPPPLPPPSIERITLKPNTGGAGRRGRKRGVRLVIGRPPTGLA